ncbi:MAG: hypothetical protein CSA58_00230 [Micrococcales bacterium]|nr:MAG: hypothetical protein CSA58_12890 [Micrococcales bacterium]PIE28210.1 MAG: hypothetical protein CSA58_00230 [Micrococcales bacterium]
MLDAARLLLSHSGPSVPQRRRGACWLARSALESAVDRLLADRGIDASRASMRVQLICLRAVGGTGETAHVAEHAWAGLSTAAHQHAYELAPTVAETAHLIALVEEVVSAATKAPANPAPAGAEAR